MNTNYDFESFGDFRFRFKQGDVWVDFFFDLGGNENELGIIYKPVGTSGLLSPELVDFARQALIKHLEEKGYKINILPW